MKRKAGYGGQKPKKLVPVTRSGKGVPDIALIASENIYVYESQGMLDNWDDYINGSKVSSET